MASSKEYLEYILDNLSQTNSITYRPMMGEFILYHNGKVFGGIYDDRFLIKPTAAAERLLPDAKREIPYDGAKEMLLVENTDDRDFLETLVTAVSAEIPLPKPKRRKNNGF